MKHVLIQPKDTRKHIEVLRVTKTSMKSKKNYPMNNIKPDKQTNKHNIHNKNHQQSADN